MGRWNWNRKERQLLSALAVFWFAFLAGGVVLILPQSLFDRFEAVGLPAWFYQAIVALVTAALAGLLVLGIVRLVAIIRALSATSADGDYPEDSTLFASSQTVPPDEGAERCSDRVVVPELVAKATDQAQRLKSEERDYLDTSRDLRPAWLADDLNDSEEIVELPTDVADAREESVETQKLMTRLRAFANPALANTPADKSAAPRQQQRYSGIESGSSDALLLRLASALDEREHLHTVERLRRFQSAAQEEPASESLSDPQAALRDAFAQFKKAKRY